MKDITNAPDVRLLLVGARFAVVEICDPDADYNTREYSLCLDGKEIMRSDKTVETVFDLTPDTEYSLTAQRDGFASGELRFTTKHESVTFNVRDFGAYGDGMTDDTKYIQSAILSCPKDGRLLIPKGTFRFTNLFLKSGITLELAKGCIMSAIPDKKLLPILPGRAENSDGSGEYILSGWEGSPQSCFASLITGIEVYDAVICGKGTVDGSAGFENWWNKEYLKDCPGRPRMMFLNKCKNVTVVGITVKNSPSWNFHPFFSQNIGFYDLKILSPADSHNTDGINPESCSDVEIAGVYFSVGDDCIAIKSGKLYMGKTYKTPSKNISVRRCLMNRGHGGVTVGSESAAGVLNVSVKNCRFVSTDRGLRIKTRRGRGQDSYVSGINFENVRMEGVITPFVINCFYYCDPDGKTEYVSCKDKLPVDERTPRIGSITVKNTVCTGCHAAGIYFYCLPESPAESVTVSDTIISFDENARPARPAMMTGCEPVCRKGVFMRNIKRVEFKNVVINGSDGSPEDIMGVEKFVRDGETVG